MNAPAPDAAAVPVLVLVGLPGAGKTTVGARVAAALGVSALDTDELVGEAAGIPAQDAFIDLGEERFRELESAAVARALAEPGAVVSLGSGALDGAAGEGVRRRLVELREAGTLVVDLEVSLAAAAPRQGLVGPQPVGLGMPRAMLAAFAKARVPAYRDVASLVIDTTGREAAGVADDILASLRAGEAGAARTLS